MQYDVSAPRATATGTLVNYGTRLKGLVIVGTATAGSVVFRDGGAGGTIRLTIDIVANGEKDITIPGEGILFSTDIHVTLTNVTSVVGFIA